MYRGLTRLSSRRFCLHKVNNAAFENEYDRHLSADSPIRNYLGSSQQFEKIYNEVYFPQPVHSPPFPSYLLHGHSKVNSPSTQSFPNTQLYKLQNLDYMHTDLTTLTGDHHRHHSAKFVPETISQIHSNQLYLHGIGSADAIDLFKQLQGFDLCDVEVRNCVSGNQKFAILTFDSELKAEVFLKEKSADVLTEKQLPAWDRTLVLQGFNSQAKGEEILGLLSEFGPIAEFQFPETMKNPTLPTEEEVMKFVEEEGINAQVHTVVLNAKTMGETINFRQAYSQKVEQQDQEAQVYADTEALYAQKWGFVKDGIFQEENNQELEQQYKENKEYTNKQFCFVQFVSKEHAQLAMLKLNGKSYNSHKLKVYLKENSTFLHYDKEYLLSKLHYLWMDQSRQQVDLSETKEELTEVISQNTLSQENKYDINVEKKRLSQKFGRQNTEEAQEQFSIEEDYNQIDEEIHQKRLDSEAQLEKDLKRLLYGRYDDELMKNLIESNPHSYVKGPGFLSEILDERNEINWDVLGLRQELELEGLQNFKTQDNQAFVTQEDLERIQKRFILSKQEVIRIIQDSEGYLKTQREIRRTKESLPVSFEKRLLQQLKHGQEVIQIFMKDYGYLVSQFEASLDPEAQVAQLNQESPLGTTYKLQQNAQGSTVIAKYLKTPYQIDLEAVRNLDVDSLAQEAGVETFDHIDQSVLDSITEEEMMQMSGFSREQVMNVLLFDPEDKEVQAQLNEQAALIDLKQQQGREALFDGILFIKDMEQGWKVQETDGQFKNPGYTPY